MMSMAFEPIESALERRGQSCPKLLPIYWFDEVECRSSTEWLVDGLLPDNGLSALWGDPGCGKSFFALDIALVVAQGLPWRGKATNPGGVVYLAAEGGRGVFKRLVALREQFKPAAGLPLAIIPASVSLCGRADEAPTLIQTIAETGRQMSVPLRLVIIDTLARVMAGGNENDPQDMMAVIANADRIRRETGAHVMLVHHSGKDKTRLLRGHTSLHGALDTAIEITLDEATGIRTAKVRKQKDGEDGQTFAFSLVTVQLTDGESANSTSCIINHRYDESIDAAASQKVTGVSAIALEALTRSVCEQGSIPPANDQIPSQTSAVTIEQWRGFFYEMRSTESSEARKKSFQRASTRLQEMHRIAIWGGYVWPL